MSKMVSKTVGLRCRARRARYFDADAGGPKPLQVECSEGFRRPLLLQTRFDRANGATITFGDAGQGFTGVERLDQEALFLLAPGLAHVSQ